MEDFNIVLRAHEHSFGIPSHGLPSEEFQNFIEQKDLFDIEVLVTNILSQRVATMILSLLG